MKTTNAAMTEVIESAGTRVTGGEPIEDTVELWIDAGVTAEQAEPYIEAGCWDAERVAELVAAGVSAAQLADVDVIDALVAARDWSSRQRGGQGYSRDDMTDSLAYLHSNCDVSTESIVAAIRETEVK